MKTTLVKILRNTWFQGGVIFLIVLVFFGFFQFITSDIYGFDSFYHLGMAEMILEKGFVQDFPWLNFTFLNENYVDHHLLFHLALTPFVFFDKLIGGKIAVAVFAALAFLAFYLMLRGLKIRFSFLWTIILLICSHALIFRLELIRAQSLSLFILFLSVYFALKKKYIWLLIFAYLYAILFDGFISILVLLFAFGIAGFIYHLVRLGAKHRKSIQGKKTSPLAYFIPFLVALLGSILGVVINPYFPKNVSFLYLHLIKIGIFNPQGDVTVGNEWYPYTLENLISNSSLAMIMIVVSFILFIIYIIAVILKWKKENKLTEEESVIWLASFVFFVIFFVAVLRSKRFVEYFIPFTIFMSAVTCHCVTVRLAGRDISKYFKRWKWYFAPVSFIVVFVIILLSVAATINLKATYDNAKSTRDVHRYEAAANWLAANSDEGEIIFNMDWDDFPLLFYDNRKNYYIVGLDPVFMADYNRELYDTWRDIGDKKNSEIIDIVSNTFNSRYIFMDSKHENFEKKLERSKDFKQVYSDEYTRIFEVRD